MHSAETTTTLRPGERLLAGKPYVYDQTLLNEHLAAERLASVPADLSALSFDDLSGLLYDCGLVRRRHDPAHRELAGRVAAERATRPEYERAFGARSSQEAAA